MLDNPNLKETPFSKLLIAIACLNAACLYADSDPAELEFDRSRPEPAREIQDQKTYPDWWHESMKTREDRVEWWKDARWGQFMHWGAYSVLGGEYQGKVLEGQYGEHISRIFRIPKEDYIEHAASKFRPEKFDADEWVLRAKEAGMKFFIITAKHHEGFAIYHSKYSDFDVEDAAGWERDPLKELSEACKRHGLHFGVYYSHAQDWFVPGNSHNDWDFPGNPATNPNQKKLGVRRWWEREDLPEVQEHMTKAWDYYINKSIPQVIELIQDYDVELFWFDTNTWMPPEYNVRVLKTVREYAPDIIVNARIQNHYGDYVGGPDGPIVFPYLDSDWECIQSTLHSWGYNPHDEGNRRPTDELLKMLARVVSKDGVMMMNIGPKPDGTWVEGDLVTYDEIGDWWEVHGESIRGAGPAPLGVHNWGEITQNGNNIYLHVFYWPKDGKLRVGGLESRPSEVVLMDGNRKLKSKQNGDLLTIDLPQKQPDKPYHSVIKLAFDDAPEGEFLRPVDAGVTNRFHVYDTPFFSDTLATKNGAGAEAYLFRWSKDAQVKWPLLIPESTQYRVHVIYDLPPQGDFSDSYVVEIGGKELKGTVSRAGTGDSKWVEQEKELMRIGQGKPLITDVITDDLGVIEITEGKQDLVLKTPGKKGPKEVFRPRAIILEPAT